MHVSEPGTDAAAPGAISMVLMADPVSLSVVRQRFRTWLGRLRWPTDEVDEIRWVTVEEAEQLLNYERDSALVREALDRAG